MTEENERRKYGQPPKSGPSRKQRNIAFARGLSSSELIAILQLELLRARNHSPAATEATLPTEVIHDIKFRLQYYRDEIGEIGDDARRAYFKDRHRDDEGRDD